MISAYFNKFSKSFKDEGLNILWIELIKVKWKAVGSLVILGLSILAGIAGPAIVQKFIDSAILGVGSNELVFFAYAYAAVAIFGGLARVASTAMAVDTSWQIADSLRFQLFHRFTVNSPVLEIEKRPIGEVLELVEGNADTIGRSISESGFRLIGNIASTIGVLVIIFMKLPQTGISISILIFLSFLVINKLGRASVVLWKNVRHQKADFFGFIGDILAARNDLYALNELNWAVDRTKVLVEDLYQKEGRAYILARAFWPIMQLVVALMFGICFTYALQELQFGAVTIGTISAIYLYLDLLQKPLEELASQAGNLQQLRAAMSIVAKTFSDFVGESSATAILPEGSPAVKFENVHFSYNQGPAVLKGLSFSIKPGSKLGIIGRTGSGKSTIMNLICGLVTPNQGRVTIGDIDAAKISPSSFAKNIAVLSQRSHLFSSSLRDNLTLFSTEINDQIWVVMAKLDATALIKDLPDGLDTFVGVGGRKFSEGEKQILMAARTMLKPFGLLLIDEATSYMDEVLEKKWAKLIRTASEGRTVIMIEHRKWAIAEADTIIVLEEGRIVEQRERN